MSGGGGLLLTILSFFFPPSGSQEPPLAFFELCSRRHRDPDRNAYLHDPWRSVGCISRGCERGVEPSPGSESGLKAQPRGVRRLRYRFVKFTVTATRTGTAWPLTFVGS